MTRENYNALMEYVGSGTQETAGLAADMARKVNSGNTGALAGLANTLGQIGEQQGRAARDIADWTSGLSEQMDQLIRDMEEDVGELAMRDGVVQTQGNKAQSVFQMVAESV